ncbi:MAG TPA: phenylalanine--tRNA ligase subunit beta [Gammaproteobacteria bacterium]|nr:phenylalanine--tRNA ligase subunit beta [Gammaproteobacteria bacterium]
MKFSELWLKEWVNPALSREELSEQLTMAGLEIDGLEPVADSFQGVAVGQILSVKKHPNADTLTVCEVNVNQDKPLTIVCGAANVRKGMKAPVALINAVLPNKPVIQEVSMRGVTSQGMLCSAQDIGLTEKSEGLLELHKSAPVGADVWEYLSLNDYIYDVAITPNRGDCLSIRGMAREVSALTNAPIKKISMPMVKPTITDVFPVEIAADDACPHYVGRVIKGIKADAVTPLWMEERLKRSGIRPISPVVDVTNYVMLELGQPMHAFDLAKLNQKIIVRMANVDEELQLLDGAAVKLTPQTLVIADAEKPLAIAGVMGGIDSGINFLTHDIFLESAFFTPTVVSRQRQMHQLNSESSYRFERGVDPQLQIQAMERATALLLKIVGGKAGPIIDLQKEYQDKLSLSLKAEAIPALLGTSTISDPEIKSIFKRLGFEYKKVKNVWQVKVPTWRFDVTEEVDLIEEIARLHGYNNIAPTKPFFPVPKHEITESQISLPRMRRLFCDLGYNEVITYSFVNAQWQKLLDPEKTAKPLVNPITADMSVMRTNLWPGLLGAYLYNRDRQQLRNRFFETGLCFEKDGNHLLQVAKLGGLISGSALPEQWGEITRPLDFYDLKGDIENILQLTAIDSAEFQFKPLAHPALHPGQAAQLYKKDQLMGVLGAMHPAIRQEFGINEPIFLFEFNLSAISQSLFPVFKEISKFPEIRRDLALLADRHIPTEEIQAVIVENGGELLRQVIIFDVYLGDGVPENKKSVAFALTLQHALRTLRDEEVAETMERIIRALQHKLGIELRG